ncbi:endolysin [Sporosarcina phage Lietuvens]|nr:endolysin [Sporosarcina phage Lietuvens]
MVKVVLDAGHGINTPGKRSPADEREWSFNSAVLLACAAHLKTYAGVEILRVDDATGRTDVPLGTRTSRANAWRADIYVSIHHNANTAKWGAWGGVETFTMDHPQANPKSRALANAVHPRIVKAMGLRDRGVKKANLHVLRETNMPAILTEGGFMDSTTDIGALRDSAKLKAQGIAIAEGIADYFGLKGGASTATKPKPAVPAPTQPIAEEAKFLHLNSRQADEIADVYEFARSKGVFSSEQHAKDAKAGKLTVDNAIYLNTLIAAASLNGGKRV